MPLPMAARRQLEGALLQPLARLCGALVPWLASQLWLAVVRALTLLATASTRSRAADLFAVGGVSWSTLGRSWPTSGLASASGLLMTRVCRAALSPLPPLLSSACARASGLSKALLALASIP